MNSFESLVSDCFYYATLRFYLIIMALQVMLYKISVHGISDIGLVRQNNEDFWNHLLEDQFFVLADGMGGHQAGEVASREAVNQLCMRFKEKSSSFNKSLPLCTQQIVEAIQEVNYAIYRMGRENDSLKGMGTTLCCVFLHGDGIVFGHVGDSRIYRFRNNHLEQITQDHSLLRELIDLGQLNEQQANEFAYKNIITKAIGTEPFVEPTVSSDSIQVGDIIVMCTDGLSDLLTKKEMQRIIAETPEEDVAKKLVKAAKCKGGYDNITVVIIKIQDKYEPTDLSGL